MKRSPLFTLTFLFAAASVRAGQDIGDIQLDPKTHTLFSVGAGCVVAGVAYVTKNIHTLTASFGSASERIAKSKIWGEFTRPRPLHDRVPDQIVAR